MSIHVKQSTTSKIADAKDPTTVEADATNLLDRFDADSIFGVIMMVIIWGLFFATFWPSYRTIEVEPREPIIQNVNYL